MTIFAGTPYTEQSENVGATHVRCRSEYECGCVVEITYIRRPPGYDGPFITSGPIDPATAPPVDPEPQLCAEHWQAWFEVCADYEGIPEEWRIQ